MHITRQIHSDGKKRRSFVALLFTAGDLRFCIKMKPTLRIQHKLWGEMITFDDPQGLEIEWLPSDYNQRKLEFSIIGNNLGPLVEDVNRVFQILSERDQILIGISLFLIKNEDRYSFVPYMIDIELKWIQFFDPARSDRFYANCIAEFPESANVFPKTGCAGNGYWDLKFQMEEMKVIDLVGE